MSDHGCCRAELLKTWIGLAAELRQGPIEVTISTAPPLVANPFTEACTCPHGTTYWIEPTGEQIAKWRAAGAP